MEKWRKLPDEFKLTDVVNQLGIKNAYARQVCAKMLKAGLKEKKSRVIRPGLLVCEFMSL